MVTNDKSSAVVPVRRRPQRQDVIVVRKPGQRRQYTSQHFTADKPVSRRNRKAKTAVEVYDADLRKSADVSVIEERHDQLINDEAPPASSFLSSPKPNTTEMDLYGDLIDALSSDSDLTDVPDDIGPSPFFSDNDLDPPTVLREIQARQKHKTRKKTRKRRSEEDGAATPVGKSRKNATTSPYFPSVKHAHRPQFLATLPFPPLSRERFGLMQENLAHDPYRMLLATIFLNKTPGIRAMPIFYKLMEKYPTPQALASAEAADVTSIIRELGFQNQRARKCIEFSKVWARAPPKMGTRYRKLHYPVKGAGRDVKEGETIDDDDPRIAWEISHLPGLGPYSHDSWRMFCRDTLRGKAQDWLGNGATDKKFEPEWKRILPTDKELRAWMTWMWLKEGWVWNKESGEKTKAEDELMHLAQGGGIVQEEAQKSHLTLKSLQDEEALDNVRVERPAGNFMP